MSKKNGSKKEFKTENVFVLCLFLLSFTLMFSRFGISVKRLIFSIKDLALSIAHWFVFVFEGLFIALRGEAPRVNVSVNTLPMVDVQSVLPFDLAELIYKFEHLRYAIADSEYFYKYNVWLLEKLYDITLYTSTFLPLIVILWLLIKEMILSENDKALGYKSKNLVRFEGVLYSSKPIFLAVFEFFKRVFSKGKIRIPLLLIWLVNFNVFTLGFELLAYYYYFISSFDLASVPVQLVKLGVDVLIMIFGATLFVFSIIAFVIFNIWRKKKGYKRLNHFESKNCGFAKETNTVSMIVGPMGLGKTAFATDLTLCWVNIFKRMSHDILYAQDMLFPMFPWLSFEKDIKEKTLNRDIVCLPDVEAFVWELEQIFLVESVIYDYDAYSYGTERNVGNKIISLFSVLKEYGKAYFVYINENPSLANYSIRFDGKFDDSEFFPLWNGDFFDSKPGEGESRYSHILDQDIMRMGTLVEEDNPLAGSFSFGVYTNTEWGKGRGNQLTLQGVDANAEEANQKNDLYSYSLKMCRHASVMIDNQVFFRFIGDEQRPQSIAQDLRDLVSVISIIDKSEIKLALPCFFIGNFIYKKLYEPFKEFYYEYRNKRGDHILFVTLLKLIVSAFSNYYKKIYNTFGYFELDVAIESGTAYGDGAPASSEVKLHKYYLAIKKIYSDRYSTDCYQQFFSKRQLECDFGINDYPTYNGLKMSYEEMEKQHDYFIMDLMKIMSGEKKTVKASFNSAGKQKTKVNFDWDV